MSNNINPTTINEYFQWIENTIDSKSALYNAAHNYLEEQRNLNSVINDDPVPFLSVITRTQGKRPEMLTETLLCLTGQSNVDFELLVIGHNLNDDQYETVTGIINDMPDWMTKRTRFIPVNGGTRTTPLNVGFSSAKGEYIAILDDDDIVFDNWVEEFYKMSKQTPGRILHSYAIYQDWETVGNTTIPRAAEAPKNTFCKDFRLIDEIALNVCPPVCLAFPSYAFKEYGIHFDESLTTTEDWDYLMRVAFVTGVTNSSVTTCVYRNWLNAENSQTVHGKDEWDYNYDKIVNRFLSTPIVMPSDSLGRCVSAITHKLKRSNDLSTSCVELFYDDGVGFTGGRTMPIRKSNNSEWVFESTELKKYGKINALRFDPVEEGNIVVEDLKIQITKEDGTVSEYDLSAVETNGYIIDKKIIFIKNDPQVVIKFKEPITVSAFYVKYDFENGISDDMLDRILVPQYSVWYRGVRFIWKKIKKLIKV